MPRKSDLYLTGSDAAKIRRYFGIKTPQDFKILMDVIAPDIVAFDDFGALPFRLAIDLSCSGLAVIDTIKVDGWLDDFQIIRISPKLLNGMRAFTENSVSDFDMPEPIFPIYRGDPYLKPYDHNGEEAEFDDIFKGLPDYQNWGDTIFLLSEDRLKSELGKCDLYRFLHRTPYRPVSMINRQSLRSLRAIALKETLNYPLTGATD